MIEYQSFLFESRALFDRMGRGLLMKLSHIQTESEEAEQGRHRIGELMRLVSVLQQSAHNPPENRRMSVGVSGMYLF